MNNLFESEEEYEAFRAWALEGSSISQRMNDGPGAVELKIPPTWELLAPTATAEKYPATYADFLKKYDNNRAGR